MTLPVIGLSLIVQHLEATHTRVFISTLHRNTVTSPFSCCIFSQTCFQIVLPSKTKKVKKAKALEKLSLPATCCSLLLTASHSRCCVLGCLPKAGALRHSALLAFKCMAVAVAVAPGCVGRRGLRCSPLEAPCVALLKHLLWREVKSGSSLFVPTLPPHRTVGLKQAF